MEVVQEVPDDHGAEHVHQDVPAAASGVLHEAVGLAFVPQGRVQPGQHADVLVGQKREASNW